MTTLVVPIQWKRATASEWASANPVLGQSEAGHEIDTNLFKLGNGATTWNALGYVNTAGGGGSGANLTSSPTSTTVVVVSDTGSDATLVAADGTNAGVMTSAMQVKLGGITSGATANSSDATLLNRANHTGITPIVGGGTGAATLPNGLLKGAGTGAISLAVPGTDYSVPADITAAQLVTINPQSGTSYTLALTDVGKSVEMSNAAANSVIVPLNSTIAFPLGAVIELVQIGAGQTTVAPVSGAVTINGADTLKLRKQWSSAYLRKRATDSWLLTGDTI